MFHDKTYEQRSNDTMFELSERKFEERWPGPFFKYGLGQDANQLATWKMDAFVAHTPDYIAAITAETEPFFVEVQGTGGHTLPRTHKIKKKKFNELAEWDKIAKVTLWLWDEQEQTFIWMSFKAFRMAVLQGKATEGDFDGFRPYWAIDIPTLQEIEDSEQLCKEFGERGW